MSNIHSNKALIHDAILETLNEILPASLRYGLSGPRGDELTDAEVEKYKKEVEDYEKAGAGMARPEETAVYRKAKAALEKHFNQLGSEEAGANLLLRMAPEAIRMQIKPLEVPGLPRKFVDFEKLPERLKKIFKPSELEKLNYSDLLLLGKNFLGYSDDELERLRNRLKPKGMSDGDFEKLAKGSISKPLASKLKKGVDPRAEQALKRDLIKDLTITPEQAKETMGRPGLLSPGRMLDPELVNKLIKDFVDENSLLVYNVKSIHPEVEDDLVKRVAKVILKTLNKNKVLGTSDLWPGEEDEPEPEPEPVSETLIAEISIPLSDPVPEKYLNYYLRYLGRELKNLLERHPEAEETYKTLLQHLFAFKILAEPGKKFSDEQEEEV